MAFRNIFKRNTLFRGISVPFFIDEILRKPNGLMINNKLKIECFDLVF